MKTFKVTFFIGIFMLGAGSGQIFANLTKNGAMVLIIVGVLLALASIIVMRLNREKVS